MITTTLAATRAYSAAARLSELAGSSAPETSGGDFGELLNASLHAVVDAGRTADAAPQNDLTGKADVVDVVTAVADLWTTFDTVVAIRDRVISVYEDIMKMPI